MNSKSFRSGAAILALALVCGARAQSLSGVATKQVNGGTQVLIQGHDLAQPKLSWSKSKTMFFLTFEGNLEGKAKTVQVGSNGVKAVSYAWADRRPAKVRVALTIAKGAKPELVQTDGQWAVNFNVSAVSPQTTAVTPKYPDKVPAIQPAFKASDLQVNNNPNTNFSGAAKVDLDFVNTDIVQILKALALQANVNIVTSPDVSGKITVTLEQVTVKDALDIVTALGGVRYAKVGNTFVVTSNSRFSETLQHITGQADASSESRVVPLYSGEGTQIKAAVLKSVSQNTVTGKYDLVLPSDKVTVDTKQSTQAADTQGDKGGAAGGDKGAGGSEISTSSDTNATGGKRDDYVVLIGSHSRLDEVEKAIKSIDMQICTAMGIKVTQGTGIVQRSYEPRGISAEELLAVLKSDKSLDFGNVKLLATPKQSTSRQSVVLSGRAAEVENLLTIMQSLDSPAVGGPTFYEVLDLKYVKPQVAAVELMANIGGLKATILPPPVDPLQGIEYTHDALFSAGGATGDKGAGGGDDKGGDKGGNGGGGGGGDQGGGSGAGNDPTKSNLSGKGADKTTMWSAEVKTFRTPMKVLLRGTREQIDRARSFLAMVDIAPKQVAVEIRVMELSKEDALKVGLDWSLLTGGSLTNVRVNQGLGSESAAGGIGGDAKFKGGGALSVTGVLDGLSNKNNMLARPNMLLTDGVVSNIFVGDTIRYVKAINSAANTGTTIITDEINVGVDFSLAARVGDGGNITLDFNPVLSILQGFTDVPGGGKLPQTSVRSAKSSVQIMSGETIAIGGLIQEQDRKSYGGIPILKDLPIIGQLFGRTSTSKIRSEVVFFITVKEVDATNRQPAANPRQSEKDNKDWPGNGNLKGKGG